MTIPDYPHWFRGSNPSVKVSPCYICNVLWPPRAMSHITEYPYCSLNQFLTFERTRVERIPLHFPPAQRLYLLKTRYTNYMESKFSLDTIFARSQRDADPDIYQPHIFKWPPTSAPFPLQFITDALIDEAYQMKPSSTYEIRKKYLVKLIQQQVLPPDAIQRIYPHVNRM